MEFGKRHDTTDTCGLCPRHLVTDVTDLLRGSYGETGVIELGLYHAYQRSRAIPTSLRPLKAQRKHPHLHCECLEPLFIAITLSAANHCS